MDAINYKKRVILSALSVSLLFGCGPSPEEIAEQERLAEEARVEQERLEIEAAFAEQKRRNDLATLTCNIMGESRNMDAAMRIKEINAARERLDEDLYLGTDEGIKVSFEYGLCKELVLNDPDYDSKLLSILTAIAEQEAEALERRRVAAEKREEEARIAREKREEEARIAAEKKAKIIAKNRAIYTDAVIGVLEEFPIKPPTLKGLFMGLSILDRPVIEVEYYCTGIKGLNIDVIVKFKDNIGEVRKNNSIGSCYGGDYEISLDSSFDKFTETIIDIAYEDDPVSYIDSIYIEWTGGIYLDNYKENFEPKEWRDIIKRIDPKRYDGLVYGEKITLEDKVSYQIFPK